MQHLRERSVTRREVGIARRLSERTQRVLGNAARAATLGSISRRLVSGSGWVYAHTTRQGNGLYLRARVWMVAR